MEKITGYDVVLTFAPIEEITGHVFEVFDYYLFLRDYCRVGMLFLGNMTRDKLKTAFESKYIDSFDDIQKDLIYYSLEDLKSKKIFMFDQDTRVLVADGNVHLLQTYDIKLLSRHLFGFLCFDNEMNLDEHNRSIYKNMVYLQDYRIYGRNLKFNSVDYVKKLPFSHYRRHERTYDNTGMMYLTFHCRKIYPTTIMEYFIQSGCDRCILVVPYKIPEYEGIDRNIIQVEAPLKNFFESFDTYIYTPIKRQFDCSSRLTTECFMLGKKIYMDLPYVDIALQTRYSDCTSNLESLNLKAGDGILEILGL